MNWNEIFWPQYNINFVHLNSLEWSQYHLLRLKEREREVIVQLIYCLRKLKTVTKYWLRENRDEPETFLVLNLKD